MPAAFEKCVREGGRVRTKKLKDGRYVHICYPPGGGPSEAGEVKKKQDKK
jgi:putative hemolysin